MSLRRVDDVSLAKIKVLDLQCFFDSWDDGHWEYIRKNRHILSTQDNAGNYTSFAVHGPAIDGFWTVYKLAVASKFRKNGISRKLIVALLQIAREQGSIGLELLVPEHMTVPEDPEYILPWLQALGFEAEKTYHKVLWHCGEEEDCYGFTRRF